MISLMILGHEEIEKPKPFPSKNSTKAQSAIVGGLAPHTVLIAVHISCFIFTL